MHTVPVQLRSLCGRVFFIDCDRDTKCEVFLGHYYAHDKFYQLGYFAIVTMGRKVY